MILIMLMGIGMRKGILYLIKKSSLRLYPFHLFGYSGKMVKIKLIVEEIE